MIVELSFTQDSIMITFFLWICTRLYSWAQKSPLKEKTPVGVGRQK